MAWVPWRLPLLLLAAANSIAAQGTTTIHVPPTRPTDAAGPVDPAFVGFAFEQADFYWYAFDTETGDPNTLSQNLINSVAKRTGATPILRVGGTSGDKGRYNASLELPVRRRDFGNATAPHLRCNGDDCLQVGPSYFDAFKQLQDVRYMFMVPQMPPELHNTLEWANVGLQTIGDRLQILEIGNEPDLAFPNYSPTSFAKSFNKYARSIKAQHPNRKKKLFQALDVSYRGGPSLSPQQAIESGLKADNVSQVAYHYYGKIFPDDTISGLQGSIANHSYLLHGGHGNHGMGVYEKYIQQAHDQGLGFIFSEVGSDGGTRTLPKGNRVRRNNMATALWNADFMLHSMAIGADRVNMQTCESFLFSLWQPNPSKFSDVRQVNPVFYALPFVADFIGQSGITHVKELGTHNNGKLVTYAAYQGTKLARVAVLNLDLWVVADGARPATVVKLANLPDSMNSAKAQFFTAAGGAYGVHPTWNGMQYNQTGNEVQVLEDSQQLRLQDGVVTLKLNSTSAAIVHFS